MKKETIVYLQDVLECVDLIQKYVKGVRWRDFERDRQMQDAVMRRLEIIGEAVKQIPEGVRKEYPEMPWRQIAGMRDVLAHEYGEVRLERVWKTVQDDLDPLKVGMQGILKKKKN